METQQLDDDDLADGDLVIAYRAGLKGKLDAIAAEAKQRLAAENLDIPLFFVLPNSGSSIVHFGTPGDPDEQAWRRVSMVVADVIKEAVGAQRVQCREMQWAATDDPSPV